MVVSGLLSSSSHDPASVLNLQGGARVEEGWGAGGGGPERKHVFIMLYFSCRWEHGFEPTWMYSMHVATAGKLLTAAVEKNPST